MSKQGQSKKQEEVCSPLPETILRQLVLSLSVVDDPRWPRGTRHPLVNVLTIAVLGCMCRCDDAMGTQVKIARQIVKAGGDYLLALKGNQSSLHTEVEAAFEEALDDRQRTVDEIPPPQVMTDTEVDGGHGRIETRVARVLTDFGPWVPEMHRWAGLRSLVAVTATREDLVTGKEATETRYYVSSRELTAAQANERVRAHWLVENQLHWCLDMTFGQDACRIRSGHATENFAVVRHFALNLIRNYKGDRYSVPRRRRLCDYDRDYRSRVLQATI